MNGKVWDKWEDKYLKSLYAYTSNEMLARHLFRTEKSVAARAKLLGLRKSKAYLKQIAEESNLLQHGAKHRFAKGHVPANKGTKMDAELRKKVEHTFFKSGNLPHNTLEDGVITTRRDNRGVNYQFIRVALGKWLHLHVKVWQDANGPIPQGHIVRFKDGNTMNCNIENLECISKRENMLRNTIQRYPEDLKSAMHALGKLKRTIKNKTKNNND